MIAIVQHRIASRGKGAEMPNVLEMRLQVLPERPTQLPVLLVISLPDLTT